MPTDYYRDPYATSFIQPRRPQRIGPNGLPIDDEYMPESSTSGGGGEIPPEGFFDRQPGGPRDIAIAAPNPYDANPNPMLRALGVADPLAAMGIQGQNPMARPGFGVFPGAVQAAGPAPAMGAGRGPRPVDGASFFQSEPMDVNEFLASQRGTTYQGIQSWNPATDAGYQAAVEAETERRMSDPRSGVNALNPIQRTLMRQRVQADPEFRRQYQIQTQGYDPRFNRMLYPEGFDPNTDATFLRRSAELASQRRGLRESAMAPLIPEQVRRAQDAATIQQLLSFFGPL
jgi:hypothetical protein